MSKVLLLVVIAYAPVWPQPADDGKPASSNVMGAQYPRIHSNLSATFRLKAPEAQKVQVQVGADQKHYDLTKGDDGVWTGSTPPIVPGFHYYYFYVDGVQVNDPASHSFYGVSKDSSGIEVPEMGVDFYDVMSKTCRTTHSRKPASRPYTTNRRVPRTSGRPGAAI